MQQPHTYKRYKHTLTLTHTIPHTHTQFLMSANGTLPAPGRNLTYFGWRVTSVPDGRPVASVAGFAGQLKLPVGKYTIRMVAVDSRGANSTASRDFVIGASSGGAKSAADSNSTALAVISLPPPAVAAASGAGLTRVALNAAGSAPAGGAQLHNVLWAVVALPGRSPAANSTGMQAEVWLPPGDYQVWPCVLLTACAFADCRP